MSEGSEVEGTALPPESSELVPFIVICNPESGIDLEELHKKLNLATINECLPSAQTRESVVAQLRAKGFTIFVEDSKNPSPLVSAEGTVELFESTFKTTLVKRVRTVRLGASSYQQVWFACASGADQPAAGVIQGALLIVLLEPPLFITPRIPLPGNRFSLRVPGDIAQLTMSSATHRQSTPAGDPATGKNIGVAVIDTGFFEHPYYEDHRYSISRHAPSDASNPQSDANGHGTSVVANVFSCAPDAHVYGIKLGPNPVLALDLAMTFPIDVISCSWVYSLPGATVLPPVPLALSIRFLTCVAAGKIVVAGAGNGQPATFPAMMPEVIAVGGVEVSQTDAFSAWSRSSSFESLIYPARYVPDLCGVATDTLLPTQPGTDGPEAWFPKPGTSFAVAQVAGICALLRQKEPQLTPAQVRDVLFNTALDVTSGKSGSGHSAGRGPDCATGAGLVDALKAWLAIV